MMAPETPSFLPLKSASVMMVSMVTSPSNVMVSSDHLEQRRPLSRCLSGYIALYCAAAVCDLGLPFVVLHRRNVLRGLVSKAATDAAMEVMPGGVTLGDALRSCGVEDPRRRPNTYRAMRRRKPRPQLNASAKASSDGVGKCVSR